MNAVRFPADTAEALAADLRTDFDFLKQMAGDSSAGDFDAAFANAVMNGESMPSFVQRMSEDYVSVLVAREKCAPDRALYYVRQTWSIR